MDKIDKDFHALEQKIDITFKNIDLLRQAFVHRSYLNENPGFELDQNERLEFLGDAVLELVVTEHLFRTYQNPEGEMTNWRAALVNAKMLAKKALELDYNKYLYLSRGESRDTGKAREIILANAYEAVIGAIFLDQGMKASETFIVENILSELPVILEQGLYIDPKSRFQELVQDKLSITPVYTVMEETGPDHAKHFTMGVYLGDTLVGEGKGSNKQEAQVAAAENALKEKTWEKIEGKNGKRRSAQS